MCQLLCLCAGAQLITPVARFSFNNGSDADEISGRRVKEVGVHTGPDRFDNKNNALYFYGNPHSYVNLGTGKALKPLAGTISLWMNMECDVWSGQGRVMESIILTKNGPGNDFYEAYNMCYYPETKHISAMCTRDSSLQLSINGTEPFELHRWHHLAITYDHDHFAFYVDGNLEKKIKKGFDTRFLEADSVMLGVTANKKNDRFYIGYIDDVEIYDRVLSPGEILELYHAPNPNRARIILNWVFSALAGIVLIILLVIIIRYRIRQVLKAQKQQMELVSKSLQNELRVQRALMNPHFIFNSLNGLQNFILTNANDEANEYLVKFSKLIRRILESNMSDTITLELEIELLRLYLDMEEMRFEEKIAYSISVDPAIVPSSTSIPIMMLQPFVENAIWHGLLNKEGDKALTISFALYGENYIYCTIEDNGIGRRTQVERAEKQSLATLFIQQRLELLNKIHGLSCSLTIEDKPGFKGTIVKINLPVLK